MHQTDHQARRTLVGVTDEYFLERLAEPSLLKSAVLLNVHSNDDPLAVPVGKLRRGGHLEFFDRREAEKAVEQLGHHAGFPNLRVVQLSKRPPYFEVRWGDSPPFDGCDWGEPVCALLLGIHYGYSDDAIAAHLLNRFEQSKPTFHDRPFNRKTILSLISSARNLR